MKTGQFTSRNALRITRAFGLVEVMVSIAIIGVMFVALFAGMSAGTSTITEANADLRATQILVDRMEEFRIYKWDYITNGAYIPATYKEPYYPNASNINYSDITQTNPAGFFYYGTITVTNVNAWNFGLAGEAYSNDLRLIIATLAWTNRAPRHRTNVTVISHYGLAQYGY